MLVYNLTKHADPTRQLNYGKDTTALEMVLATPHGIHRFAVELSNITNKAPYKHVDKAT
jgi:hypothetical protein